MKNGIFDSLAFCYPGIALLTKIGFGFAFVIGVFFIATRSAYNSGDFIFWACISVSVIAGWLWFVVKLEQRYESRQRRGAR